MLEAHAGVVEAPRTVVSTRSPEDQPPPTRILLVDDHEVVHWGYRLALNRCSWVTGCHSALGPSSALSVARKVRPDLAIVDIMLGPYSGVALARQLSRSCRVLLLCVDGTVPPDRLAASGAVGVVGKGWTVSRFIEVARLAAGGHPTDGCSPPRASRILSDRELEILTHIADGLTNQQIGSALGLSPWTIKQHCSAVYRKLGAANRAEAVQLAQRLSLLD
jgi:DNA-binding NarL/FixJ family response regulator